MTESNETRTIWNKGVYEVIEELPWVCPWDAVVDEDGDVWIVTPNGDKVITTHTLRKWLDSAEEINND